jgi:hypothetical protein
MKEILREAKFLVDGRVAGGATTNRVPTVAERHVIRDPPSRRDTNTLGLARERPLRLSDLTNAGLLDRADPQGQPPSRDFPRCRRVEQREEAP